jgi:hypothetical protein
MEHVPNFKGAGVVGYCLNVMGLTLLEDRNFRDSKALHKVLLSWTRRKLAWLHSYNPRIADACLVDGMTYDAEHRQIMKTYPEGLSREPERDRFDVDAPA